MTCGANNAIERSSPSSNKENASSKPPDIPRLKLVFNRPVDNFARETSSHNMTPTPHNLESGSSSSDSGLKIKLRGIQAALREPCSEATYSSSFLIEVPGNSSLDVVADDEDDTDSEIELVPTKSHSKKAIPQDVKGTSSINNTKIESSPAVFSYGDESLFDPGVENESSNNTVSPKLSLVTPVMKRNRRILDPNKPEHAKLLVNATKVGAEYYDSDADDVPGHVKDTNKPHLFRNVRWGSHVTDFSTASNFSKEPEFTQFVPGRFELLPDGTVADQKAKLVIKLIDKAGRKRVFANPPPRDWHNQEAITALNKRTVQQIRRNTNVRFREIVRAYVPEERRWILANLTAGKPTQGWKGFVEEFNRRFEGNEVQGAVGPRPYRSHSSLTKEVERFGAQFYVKGQVPLPAKKGRKE